MAGPIRAEGFEAAISGMAARLGLPAAVGERAKEVYRKMEEARAWPHHRPGRVRDRSKGPLYAACLSIACRNEGSPRSLRELALATSARKVEIVRMTALVRRRLGEEEAGQATGVGVVSVSSYLRRFGALVGLGEAEEAAALEAARRLEEGALDVRHNAESVAAALVCLALKRAGVRKPGTKDVAAAIGLPKMTIYRVCSRLRPHADLLFG
jgi:transcription initiation factor TFIIB